MQGTTAITPPRAPTQNGSDNAECHQQCMHAKPRGGDEGYLKVPLREGRGMQVRCGGQQSK